MSISPVSSLLSSSPLTASTAVGVQNSVLHTSIGQRAIKDQIDLSKEAVALLVGGAAPAAK
ncbi:hypothetical protein GCM10011611_00770 [Aliidongia dinghuensis]|uniref:Uncharacterized protein n=1 Tax=Aliidongia dinghuensis TaxID=1867774 RepID=A0A8J3E171_9PROT|nr:hypothetical protein [Aliidongia dinghuensis]GGE99092.1 hypothetical protein GCM10011611_00770 [Aliidongia dinghuensis]